MSQQEPNSSGWGGKGFCFLHCGVLLQLHALHSREGSAELLGTHSLDFPYKQLFLGSVGAAFLQPTRSASPDTRELLIIKHTPFTATSGLGT